LVFKGRIPPVRWYPENPETLGEHLRKARIDHGLRQEEVAAALGVGKTTICNWEMGHGDVSIRHLPKVLAFLGYDPRRESEHLGDQIRMQRERQGLSQVALAEKLDLNVSTVVAWERGRLRKLFPKVRRRFEEFLAGGPGPGGPSSGAPPPPRILASLALSLRPLTLLSRS
jgi:transcriptional regulator with XRE-family HTH domain